MTQEQKHRTRCWYSDQGSSTMVQFRTDLTPMVWMHTNIGWVGVSNAPTDEAKAEQFAVELATGYELKEHDRESAEHFAGWHEIGARNSRMDEQSHYRSEL